MADSASPDNAVKCVECKKKEIPSKPKDQLITEQKREEEVNKTRKNILFNMCLAVIAMVVILCLTKDVFKLINLLGQCWICFIYGIEVFLFAGVLIHFCCELQKIKTNSKLLAKIEDEHNDSEENMSVIKQTPVLKHNYTAWTAVFILIIMLCLWIETAIMFIKADSEKEIKDARLLLLVMLAPTVIFIKEWFPMIIAAHADSSSFPLLMVSDNSTFEETFVYFFNYSGNSTLIFNVEKGVLLYGTTNAIYLLLLVIVFPFYAHVYNKNREREKETAVFHVVDYFYSTVKIFYVFLLGSLLGAIMFVIFVRFVLFLLFIVPMIFVFGAVTFFMRAVSTTSNVFLILLSIQRCIMYFVPSSEKLLTFDDSTVKRFNLCCYGFFFILIFGISLLSHEPTHIPFFYITEMSLHDFLQFISWCDMITTPLLIQVSYLGCNRRNFEDFKDLRLVNVFEVYGSALFKLPSVGPRVVPRNTNLEMTTAVRV
ncbi:hypothetical protein CRE_23371 [Caenorhabditis remanei]|uniref:Uncharacterized protein n=1 Tax=Caenorhabditis remanei TaxID=31234 RepID=E3MH53_CAERE|nr:hypothetical protein CRE_23371 [Caenorhabditis remanei]